MLPGIIRSCISHWFSKLNSSCSYLIANFRFCHFQAWLTFLLKRNPGLKQLLCLEQQSGIWPLIFACWKDDIICYSQFLSVFKIFSITYIAVLSSAYCHWRQLWASKMKKTRRNQRMRVKKGTESPLVPTSVHSYHSQTPGWIHIWRL